MIREKIGQLKIYRWSIFTELREKINAGITTRRGGFSLPPYDSLNLGLHVEDDSAAVMKNRELCCGEFGWDIDRFTCAEQIHGSCAVRVRPEDGGSLFPAADAMITDIPGIPLAVFLADCASVVLYDKKRHCTGICHAGWRGTQGLIVLKTVEAMSREFGSDPANISAGIGPSIGPCCFTIGTDTEESLRDSFDYPDSLFIRGNGRIRFDLWEANIIQLTRSGISRSNIESAGICTVCSPDSGDFFSYRKSGGKTGRFAAFVCLC